MSAGFPARSVSQASGLDHVRALQRVLYRSAKQDPERRFHAVFDKVARSDVMGQAWRDVRANKGAPGVDGVSIDAIEQSGDAGVRVFLDDLASQLRAGKYRPSRCGGCISPSRAGRVRPGRWAFPRFATGW